MSVNGDPQSSHVAPPESLPWSGPERDVRALYRKHFKDRRKERQLFSTGSFFLTFAAVRGITHAIRAGRASQLTSLAYGAGAALTLDEFALWLNLEDDYWNKQGRESIDAVALFGSLLVLSVLGKGFFKELMGRES